MNIINDNTIRPTGLVRNSRRSSAIMPVIALGPVMPRWGSWEWIGADMACELSKYFTTKVFTWEEIPDCDIAFVIKHIQSPRWIEQTARRCAIVFCPVDIYGSAEEITAQGGLLEKCSTIVVHCKRLMRYFQAYSHVEYMDHHVRFITPMRESYQQNGPVLWIGILDHLKSLVEWVNNHPLPNRLMIMTNVPDTKYLPRPMDLGFLTNTDISVHRWTKEAHIEFSARSKAAIDIKGRSFRDYHKPPAKAIDFVASGVPLAMNFESSAVEHLAEMGFDIASPLDSERWLSAQYFEEIRAIGRVLREELSLRQIGLRYKQLIENLYK